MGRHFIVRAQESIFPFQIESNRQMTHERSVCVVIGESATKRAVADGWFRSLIIDF